MIVCSAVKFKNKSTGEMVVITGLRHFNCYGTMAVLLGKDYQKDWEVVKEGFVNHINKFFDRKQAYQYAVEIGQIPSELQLEVEKKLFNTSGFKKLYSEFLF